jgi:RNA-binding protein YhbY
MEHHHFLKIAKNSKNDIQKQVLKPIKFTYRHCNLIAVCVLKNDQRTELSGKLLMNKLFENIHLEYYTI